MSDDTRIVTVGPTAVLPFDYGDQAGAGYDNQTSQDMTLPFMVLCQDKTPMVEDGRANSGDYFDTVTETVYAGDQGFMFVPCLTKHVFAKFQKKKAGGRFRGHLEITDPRVQEAKEAAKGFAKLEITEETDDGPERLDLRETFYVYGVVVDDVNVLSMGVVFPFVSTKIRVYKQWMTRLRQLPKAPLYAHLALVTSTKTQNDQGSFFIPVIKPADPRGLVPSLLAPDDVRFTTAMKLRESILRGAAKIDYSAQETAGPDTDIPF